MTQEEAMRFKVEEDIKRSKYECGQLAQSMIDSSPIYPSTMSKLEDYIDRATKESSKLNKLLELKNLLLKHPDVARIIDLLDEVRSTV